MTFGPVSAAYEEAVLLVCGLAVLPDVSPE